MKSKSLRDKGSIIFKIASWFVIFLLFASVLYINLKSNSKEPLEITFTGSIPLLQEKYLVVDVSGAVKNPGVYTFTSGERVNEMIQKAGGFSSEADLFSVSKTINLAEIVKDGQKIFIPFAYNSNGAALSSNDSPKINLQSASREKLMELPGVGESTADDIIAARPFSAVEDLLKISGFGEAKFQKLKDLVEI